MPDDHPAFPPVTLTAENLAAKRAGRLVFAGVSFGLEGGDAMAVTGANGAGKSTLLRLLAGLLPAAEGSVAMTSSSGDKPLPFLHYSGHLDALKASLTVSDNCAFWARIAGADGGAVNDALDTVGLLPLAHLPAAVLSAGQRRRAALARLLIARRPLWLLDEPTAALDASGEAILGGMISGHLAAGGIAVIATHADLPAPPTHLLALGAAA